MTETSELTWIGPVLTDTTGVLMASVKSLSKKVKRLETLGLADNSNTLGLRAANRSDGLGLANNNNTLGLTDDRTHLRLAA